jgi:hypothetical protein
VRKKRGGIVSQKNENRGVLLQRSLPAEKISELEKLRPR